MALLLFERVGDPFAERFRGVGEGGEGMGHDFDGEELVTGKPMQANGPIFLFAVALKGGEFLLFRPFVKPHVGGPHRFIKPNRLPWALVC